MPITRRSFLGSFFKAAAIACVVPSVFAEVEQIEEGWKVYHYDDYTFRVKLNPIFDEPEKGYNKHPLESHRVIWLDTDDYNTKDWRDRRYTAEKDIR